MKKVFWFSRHDMTPEQKQALTEKLGLLDIRKVDGSPASVHVPFTGKVNGLEQELPPIKVMFQDQYDVIAIVAPIGLQQQILSVSGKVPVIMAKNNRRLVPQADGSEAKVVFDFAGWERLVKIDIVVEAF